MNDKGLAMFDIQKMLQHEISFYKLFTNKTVTEYGIVYYNHLNPLSHDSNHAHILDINGDVDKIVRDIIRFYKGYGITPRVYMSFIDNELERLRPVLESQGFTLTVLNSTFMRFELQKVRTFDSHITVRRIRHISQEILALAYSGEDRDWGEWSVKVLQAAVKNASFHLLGLFHEGKCVSLASVHIMDGYSRVDDVKTHAAFRGQHFGTQLMNYLTVYHSRTSENYLYLWAENPIAIRMYRNVGFQELNVDMPRWSAFIAPAPPASS